MSDEQPPAGSVKQRLISAGDLLESVAGAEADLPIGLKEPLLMELKSLLEEKQLQSLFLNTLIETAPTLIILVDARGRIARFNKACEELTGYSRDEAIGKTILDLLQSPVEGNGFDAHLADPFDSSLPAQGVRNWLTKSGEKRLIDWNCVSVDSPEGTGHCILGIGLDITLRKQTQDAAAEAHSFAESIIATVREPLLVLDGDLRVKAASLSFYQTFQVTPAETIDCLLHELGDQQWEAPALRQLLETILTENISFDNFEVTHEFPRVGRRVMLLNARKVLGDDEHTALILLAIEDVTDNRQAWAALYSLNRELEDRVLKRTSELETANKELEAFCYSVSHDLRTPLRAIDGFSEVLLRAHADRLDDKGRHYLERVRAGTQRMGELIDDLLQLSRFSRGDLIQDKVVLSGLALAVVAELRRREPSRQVSVDIQPELTCQGDAGLVKAALENLLSNAWKYTGKRPSATIVFGRTNHQGRLAFFVRDDGAGFDMSHAAKLFGAFQRLHPQREFPGNGIGLATVQRIIHRHGGQIWAESSPGQGATFYFTLPTKESP